MNLNLVHKILRATSDQPYGFLKVSGAHLAREVEMMAAAGLVKCTETVQGLETYTVIKEVTDSGRSFLRAFGNEAPIRNERRTSTRSRTEHAPPSTVAA